MAALGKIRSKGVVLVCVIGLGLLAFIAEEAFRSCDSVHNDKRQQVGKVLGEKISVQDYQKLVDEYTEIVKLQQGADNLTDAQMNQVKDQVWNNLIQGKIIENEAAKLGLTVTDEEMQNLLTEGTSQMLMQTPFVNQQTGRFDAETLKKFLSDYKAQKALGSQVAEQYESLYKYWTYTEKNIRQSLLMQKYQSLLMGCILTNNIEAEMAYKGANEEAQIELAAFPFTGVADTDVTISDADIKAKYKEMKTMFRQYVEMRDIKYVVVKVTASDTDIAALQKQFAEYKDELAAADDPTDVVQRSMSQVSYIGVPVTKNAFPIDIATKIDSMSVGQTSDVFETKRDNTLNIIKIFSKQQLPDSIQFRTISIFSADLDEGRQRADSVYNAVKAGGDFEAIAKVYGQTGETNWLLTKDYEKSPTIDKDSRSYLTTINNMSKGEVRNIEFAQGNIIVQVLDTKAPVDKYVVAVVKNTIDFSRDTYSAAYNKFSSFVSANKTIDDVEKNAAANGYEVNVRQNITTSVHNIANIRSTRDAVKWIFDADEGDISPMYECGDNDILLLVMLSAVNKEGYRTLKDTQVLETVKAEVLKDKKAEKITEKIAGVKSIDEAKTKGAKVATVDQVTFDAPAFIAAVGASEPVLSGAVAATDKGAFSAKPVKGNGGVYLFQVVDKTTKPGEYNAKAELAKQAQKTKQKANAFTSDLYVAAGVEDNRYLFF